MIDRDTAGKLMRDAGFSYEHHHAIEGMLMRLATLVAEHERQACAAHYLDIARKAIEEEREACAKVCDALGDEFSDANSADCATAIRARSKQ